MLLIQRSHHALRYHTRILTTSHRLLINPSQSRHLMVQRTPVSRLNHRRRVITPRTRIITPRLSLSHTVPNFRRTLRLRSALTQSSRLPLHHPQRKSHHLTNHRPITIHHRTTRRVLTRIRRNTIRMVTGILINRHRHNTVRRLLRNHFKRQSPFRRVSHISLKRLKYQRTYRNRTTTTHQRHSPVPHLLSISPNPIQRHATSLRRLPHQSHNLANLRVLNLNPHRRLSLRIHTNRQSPVHTSRRRRINRRKRHVPAFSRTSRLTGKLRRNLTLSTRTRHIILYFK